MNSPLRPLAVGYASIVTILLNFPNAAAAADAARSQWVHPGPDGKLKYETSAAGDRIMDFSYAGYLGGGSALPTLPVKRIVQPSGGPDDTSNIQVAINEVSALPVEHGFRGAVLLAPGVFTCSNTVTISANGVVLRGSGSTTNEGKRSTIKMAGQPHLAVAIRASGSRRGQNGEASVKGSEPENREFRLAETTITDTYVPSGATQFNLAEASGFAVGDTIAIRKPVTEAWVKFMQMDDLVRDGNRQTWIRTGTAITTERKISAISGRTITLDIPLSDSFDARYLNPPGTIVSRIQPTTRVSKSGIEDLHIESPPQAISHSQPHFTAMRINGEDCWARDVVVDETMNSIGVSGQRITLQRVTVTRKARHQGSSRPAEFAPNGSQVLLDHCAVNADNVWFVATGGQQAGPIVLLNCTFTGNGRAESHQRWSTGILYDNCRAPDGGIELRNRGSMGSGHGWSMGWGVLWNCVTKDYIVQNPPGALNWMIGCTGANKLAPRPFGTAPNLPAGVLDAHGTPVTPRSLYLAQLAERLGPQVLRNIGY